MRYFFINIKGYPTYLFFSIVVLLLLGSCNTRKFVKDGEYLLKKNEIVFETDQEIPKKRSLKYELSTLYKQKPNRKFLRVTKTSLWLYYRTFEIEDPNKFQSWIKRRIAEPPALYTDPIAEATANSMRYYLQHKGYYKASVRYEKKLNEKKKTASIKYIVNPQQLYTIDSVFYSTTDEKIRRIINDSKEDSHLKRGEPVSEELYNKEVERITRLLKNLGFAYFDRNFIDKLSADSTGTEVNLYFNILNPKNKTEHKIYRIGRITVDPNYNPSELPNVVKDTIINNIKFLFDENGSLVRPESIIKQIHLKQGELYKEENFSKTNRQLGRLEIYKFISIKSSLDSPESDSINFDIRLTSKKRQVIGGEIEINNSNYNSQNSRITLFGTAVNLNYANRNFRKRASLLQLQANSGIELDFANKNDIIFSLDLLLQADLNIPEFREFPKVYTIANRIGLIKDKNFQNMQEKGQTRFSVSYNRLLLFDFYNYHSFNLSLGWDLQANSNKRILWNQTGVNYLLPDFEPAFDTIRNENLFIKNSFTEQLFTGFAFRDIRYNYTSKTNLFGYSWKLIGEFEQSGGEVYFLNKLYNEATNKSSEFLLFDEVEFSQYLKANLDTRFYFNVGQGRTFALRGAIGVAVPYGFSGDVPYVKQFYGGGPFGNRAWRIRELGPGGFEDPLTSDDEDNIIFYQAGDFKIDINAEYRFDIIGRLKGALFVDAGNVWTLEFDPERPGSQFRFSEDPGVENSAPFYQQLGVGMGIGFRLDFSYFILGLDLGVKARNPYPDDLGRYGLIHRWPKYQLQDVNPNLMIGFPF